MSGAFWTESHHRQQQARLWQHYISLVFVTVTVVTVFVFCVTVFCDNDRGFSGRDARGGIDRGDIDRAIEHTLVTCRHTAELQTVYARAKYYARASTSYCA